MRSPSSEFSNLVQTPEASIETAYSTALPLGNVATDLVAKYAPLPTAVEGFISHESLAAINEVATDPKALAVAGIAAAYSAVRRVSTERSGAGRKIRGQRANAAAEPDVTGQDISPADSEASSIKGGLNQPHQYKASTPKESKVGKFPQTNIDGTVSHKVAKWDPDGGLTYYNSELGHTPTVTSKHPGHGVRVFDRDAPIQQADGFQNAVHRTADPDNLNTGKRFGIRYWANKSARATWRGERERRNALKTYSRKSYSKLP